MQKSAEGWAFCRMLAYSKDGVPDIILIKDGRFIGSDVKTDTGRLSAPQVEFAHGAEAAGGTYPVARSIEVFNKRAHSKPEDRDKRASVHTSPLR